MNSALPMHFFTSKDWLTNFTKPSSSKLKFELFMLKFTWLFHIPSYFVSEQVFPFFLGALLNAYISVRAMVITS